jgi:hypothetical protein
MDALELEDREEKADDSKQFPCLTRNLGENMIGGIAGPCL